MTAPSLSCPTTALTVARGRGSGEVNPWGALLGDPTSHRGLRERPCCTRHSRCSSTTTCTSSSLITPFLLQMLAGHRWGPTWAAGGGTQGLGSVERQASCQQARRRRECCATLHPALRLTERECPSPRRARPLMGASLAQAPRLAQGRGCTRALPWAPPATMSGAPRCCPALDWAGQGAERRVGCGAARATSRCPLPSRCRARPWARSCPPRAPLPQRSPWARTRSPPRPPTETQAATCARRPSCAHSRSAPQAPLGWTRAEGQGLSQRRGEEEEG